MYRHDVLYVKKTKFETRGFKTKPDFEVSLKRWAVLHIERFLKTDEVRVSDLLGNYTSRAGPMRVIVHHIPAALSWL